MCTRKDDQAIIYELGGQASKRKIPEMFAKRVAEIIAQKDSDFEQRQGGAHAVVFECNVNTKTQAAAVRRCFKRKRRVQTMVTYGQHYDTTRVFVGRGSEQSGSGYYQAIRMGRKPAAADQAAHYDQYAACDG